jgi:ABC-type nitrate/sulfonate/bicarbonate transport system ATPase subunit
VAKLNSGGPVKISVSHVWRAFPGRDPDHPFVAVQDVSFDVRDREFLTIVGPSGCGKSTVLNLLVGLLEPTSGEIRIDGERSEDRASHCGYMFQRDLLLPWRTIGENVALGLETQGVSKRVARDRARELLTRFNLGQFTDRHPIELSGGMRQRVALMRTLISDRPILLLDEPFGALDALTRSVMQQWLLDIWEARQRTVVFITHDIEESIFLSDRVLVMTAHPGQLKGEVSVDLPRPRTKATLGHHKFAELKQIVLDQVYDESLRTLSNEERG